MKKMSKKISLFGGLLIASTILCGNAFASYIVNDNASKNGIRIDVCSANFYLNSVSNENLLTNNWDGTWSSGEITAEYNQTYQIVDESGNNVGSSYTTTTPGKFVFTYDYALDSTSTEVVSKYVYFNFLPMAGGAQNGRVWNQFYCYAWNNADDSYKNHDWPGVEMTAVNATGLYRTEIAGNLNRIIFNNNGDSDDHMIQTGTLEYDIDEPVFGCTSKTDLTTYTLSASPTINDLSEFDYYLHTSHNSWNERSKEYGFEKTQDDTQYLLRCYLEDGDLLGIKDNSTGWWGGSNLGNSGSGFSADGSNIRISQDGYYNIYFKPGINAIYLS